MRTKKLGVYIHIPFCERKCNYCDFNSCVKNEDLQDLYIESLIEEIHRESNLYNEYEVDSIFIGGGTPSILSISNINKLGEILKKSFNISKDLEFTIEGNPNSLNFEKIKTYKDLGINRISLGGQSFVEKELSFLGRIHKKEYIYKAVDMIKNIGIERINVDLMMGIPHQNLESFKYSLNEALKLDISHISCYSLIIEEETVFGELLKNKKNLYLPSEDIEREMYTLLKNTLKENGFIHYEVSNFSKKGFQSRHNLKYWHCEDYVGFGLGSHFRLGDTRFINEDNLENYINKIKNRERVIINKEKLSKIDQINEKIIMGLRLFEKGISISDLNKEFSIDFLKDYEDVIIKNQNNGYIEIDDNYLKITDKGLDFLNLVELDFYR